MKHICLLLCLTGLPKLCAAVEPEDSAWSKPVNGVQARIEVKQVKIINDTPIMAAYLTLRNVSDVVNPIRLPFESSKLSVSIVDAAGKELPQAFGPYDGGRAQSIELILPYDSSLKFNVSQSGLGIGKGKRALLDFGPEHSWVIAGDDHKTYFLRTRLKIEQSRKRNADFGLWHGTLEIPDAPLPDAAK